VTVPGDARASTLNEGQFPAGIKMPSLCEAANMDERCHKSSTKQNSRRTE